MDLSPIYLSKENINHVEAACILNKNNVSLSV